jgi:hypothetical protein
VVDREETLDSTKPSEIPLDRLGHRGAATPIRIRAVVLGIILAVFICLLTPFNNIYRHSTPLGGGHFPLAPFFILVALTIAVALINRIGRRKLMSGKELLFTWILTVFASGIAYTGLVRTFFINLTAPYHLASVGNRWEEVLQPLLPKAWYPQDPEAVKALYRGLEGGRTMDWWQVVTHIPWSAWIGPLLILGGFVLVCYVVMICLVNILSRQWLVNERMNFPLLQVPLLMEEAADRNGLAMFFTNRFLLAGLMVPVVLHLINGLHFYIPTIPEIPTLILAGSYFPKVGLFSGFTKLKIYFYPAFIGFAFLTSRQISFSIWGFFILGGLIYGLLGVLGYNIPAADLGVTFGPHLARPEETQMIGAYGVFFLFILWLARHHLVGVLKQGVGLAPSERTETEWLSIRLAFWGFAAGVVFIIVWLSYYGVPPLVSFLVVGAFFMIMLVATRIVCQGGIAYFSLTAAPMDGMLAFFGPGFFTNVGLAISAVVQKILFVDFRESLMPSLFHSSKVSQEISNKRLILSGIAITLFLSVAVSFLAMLALCYKYGIRQMQLDWATSTTVTMLENVRSLVESPSWSGQWVRVFIIAGAVAMAALVVCFHRFYWWPLHPIGYLTAYSTSMQILWFSFFIGWLSNAVCMRYGGVALFKRLRFFFIGLIVGDFLMGGIWAVVGLFSDASYLVLPD